MEELMPARAQALGDTAQSKACVPEKLGNAASLSFLSVLCENDPKQKKKQMKNLDLHCLLTHGWL